jgi:hypothetical protein
VRDPSAVEIDIDDGRGKNLAVLPPSASASRAPLPMGSPPFVEGLQEAVTLRRRAAGAVDAICASCDPDARALVAPDGTIEFGPGLQITKLDWTKAEMRIRFRDIRAVTFGKAEYDASVATPWSNVAQVRRVSTPNRAMGLKLLLSAGVAGALDAFAFQNGLSTNNSSTTILGAVILPIAVALAAGGAWYSFAPPRESVLYGEK